MSGAAQLAQRELLDGETLAVGAAYAGPGYTGVLELEPRPCHAVALPLAGAFAKHEGARRRVLGTPAFGVLFAADEPRRISFPGGVGDRSLVLRFSDECLERILEAGMPPASGVLLPPEALLARTRLWRRLHSGSCDRLEAEERALHLLGAVLRAARPAAKAAASARCARAVEAVKEVIAVDPGQAWTLGALARVASLSPYHLSRAFRQAVGVPVHAYLTRARLAASLEAVAGGADLARVALDGGFASHSHFSARFRSFFGRRPAQWRRGMGEGDAT